MLSFLFFTFLKRNKIISWKIGSVIMSLSNMISSGVIIPVFAYVFVTDHCSTQVVFLIKVIGLLISRKFK